MAQPDAVFPTQARLLDAGGWFKPWFRATHVVDRLPYETRCGHLQLTPQPGEHFSRATWTQIDFLEPAMRLPYSDGYFDYAFCGQTIEDLRYPEPLLRELARVAKAGCIESPSRLAEQTTGVRDRICDAQGYDHHHWIIDVADGVLELSPKGESLTPTLRDHEVPLFIYEQRTVSDPGQAIARCSWKGTLRWRFIAPDSARERARDFARNLLLSRTAIFRDLLVRRLRGLKRKWFHPAAPASASWWEQMLALSEPYSTLPLCRSKSQ